MYFYAVSKSFSVVAAADHYKLTDSIIGRVAWLYSLITDVH